jgi:two-component system phosphate regulon response regulator OmpR
MTGETILVAEDDQSSSEMLKELLELSEYTVEIVETAREAVAALRARVYAAVLLDLTMPGMSREELIEALCGLPSPSPLIVFSARPAPEVREISDRLRAAAVLPKPSNIDVMLATVDRVVRRAA